MNPTKKFQDELLLHDDSATELSVPPLIPSKTLLSPEKMSDLSINFSWRVY
jgi:hypothetical protein